MQMEGLEMEVRHYRRVGAEECHYRGDLVAGALILQYASDALGELSIRYEGATALLASVEKASLYLPVFAGESLEIIVRLVKVGNRSRTFDFQVFKHLQRNSNGSVEKLEKPALVSEGRMIGVIGTDPRK